MIIANIKIRVYPDKQTYSVSGGGMTYPRCNWKFTDHMDKWIYLEGYTVLGDQVYYTEDVPTS